MSSIFQDPSNAERGRTPVTCAACGCRLEAASGAHDGEYSHFRPFDGRDARGCRVACVGLVHDASGRAIGAGAISPV